MPRQHNINGKKVPFTAKEEAEWNKKEQEWNNGAFDRAMASLRQKRNQLLLESDWTASSDLTMSDDWKNYRQSLRDATEGLTTVDEVNSYEFPTKP
jgi:hypothetical protein